MPIVAKMPKWGLMMKSGTVTGWFRAEGDPVSAGEPLFTVETDKAVNDVEAPRDGVLRRIVAGEGTVVAVSGPVAVITAAGETLTDDEVDDFVTAQTTALRPLPTGAGAAGAVRPARAPRTADRAADGRITASPAARKRARELGLDLAAVTATGPGGRITSDDVERAAAGDDGEPEPREDWLEIGAGGRLYAISAGSSSNPPIVFLHGIGGSSASWQAVIGSFAATHHVVAIDLPAHGQSDVPDPARTDYSVRGLAQAVTEALAVLGLERVTLVGHSLGGAVATGVALAAPDRVARLVLVDSTGLGDDISPDLVRLLDAPPSDSGSRALLELFFDDRRLVLDAGVNEHHAALGRPGAHAAVRAISSLAFADASQRVTLDGRSAEITQPVLVVWGGRDRVVPVAHAEAARTAIADVEVAIIPDAGHAPHVEQPAAFAAILARFLARPDG
jgi:pyruvate dehydrogenase E2 component (dihydrolipoamide acetyltransferase)